MDIIEISKAISEVGFPAVIALLLLFRLEKKLNDLSLTIEKLNQNVEKQSNDER
ncbi:hypothetical protein J2S78_002756 [Salibacterium salarium]|uniref:YvrJ family protein n=1 Tax=Salibacterium salarium TaxID=284579 RepID=UPI0027823FF5|nr:YvrJ family protein [Salibacterium salarium]MDQ0300309.1 hypothetical protein [Salibacterium salarium]